MLKRYLIFLGLIPAVVLIGLFWVRGMDPALARENGPLENIQLGFSLLSSLVFALQLRRMEPRFRGILWGGFFFGLVCAVREVDLRPLAHVPHWLELLGDGIGRDIVIGLLCIGFLFFVAQSVYRLKWAVLRVGSTWFGLFLIAAAVAILLGDVYEKKLLGGESAQLCEEFMEAVGYFLLVCSALSARSLRAVAGP
ncbi:hypothetical protein [Pontiella sp.]|uniref:hypothetical protein n=1 Tax=Pontiella sp. TaxID=2837462 RepID=UPI003564F1F6